MAHNRFGIGFNTAAVQPVETSLISYQTSAFRQKRKESDQEIAKLEKLQEMTRNQTQELQMAVNDNVLKLPSLRDVMKQNFMMAQKKIQNGILNFLL